MGRFKRALGPAILVVAVAVLWGMTATTVPAAPSPPGLQAQSTSAFVGQETCLECHEDRAEPYLMSAHARAGDSRTPAASNGCESCHGPGTAHVDEGDPELIKRFSSMSASEITETCTTCHNRGDQAFWEGSQHEGRDLSCATCHSVHEPKSEHAQLSSVTEVDGCAQCHRDKTAKLQRTAHMPVREGKLDCSTCHNPHGSVNVSLLSEGITVNDACTSCHTEKRGPFLWEHAAVQESCASCHDPHGSSNDRMLVAKQPMLCQRCHAHTRHPATVYDNSRVATSPSNRIYGRSCVNCHQNIHGSIHASGKFFLR